MNTRYFRPLWLTFALGCSATQQTAREGDHAMHMQHGAPLARTTRTAPPLAAGALTPALGLSVGQEYEAFLSPHQEPDEEENTPRLVPSQFRSQGASLSRDAREAAGHRAHGRIRFTRDMSRAYIDVRVEGIDPGSVNMFHIHCGRPGILGPILLDFALATNLQEDLADGVLSVEITNAHLTATTAAGHGLLGAFTAGCVVPSPSLGGPLTRVSTVAGMAQIAAEGELYFNLHTVTQTYFGDIRGQIYRAAPGSEAPSAAPPTAAPPTAATPTAATPTAAAPAPAQAAPGAPRAHAH